MIGGKERRDEERIKEEVKRSKCGVVDRRGEGAKRRR